MRWRTLFLVGLAALGVVGCGRRTPVPEGTIVFLGDSLTAGYGLDASQAYPALITIEGMTSLNMGVSGNTAGEGLQRLRDYFAGGGNPQLVVIALGANDILHGVNADVTEKDLTDAVQECKGRGLPVLLCGIHIPFKFGSEEIFQRVAKATQVPLLPDLMQGEETQTRLLQEDGMHPTAEGQRLIAAKMQETLLRYFSFGGGKK
jgi:acyl-CoA thioesterase-1